MKTVAIQWAIITGSVMVGIAIAAGLGFLITKSFVL